MSVSDAARDPGIPPIEGPSHIRLHALLGNGSWSCHYCRKPLLCPCVTGEDKFTFWRNGANMKSAATVDHVIPTTQGGPDTPDNIVPACMPCNSSKNGRAWPSEWVPDLDNATFVYASRVAPQWGADKLATLGVLLVLASLEPGRRYTIFEVAAMTTDGHAAVRATLSKLSWAGRLSWRVVPAVDRPFEHEFGAATGVSA